MAEVLAIPAALAAVLQLAGYGQRFAKILYQFAHDTGTVFEEVESFATQVQLFSDSIGTAHVSLHRHCSEHSNSPVTNYISAHAVLDKIASQAKYIRRRLRNARVKVGSMSSRSKLWTTIKWNYRKPTIIELIPQMQNLQTSLSLLVASAQMESLTLSWQRLPQADVNERNRLKEEINFLKSVIKGYLKTEERLQSQIDRLSLHQGFTGDKVQSSVSFRGGQLDALIELGRSMSERGVVPGVSQVPSVVAEPVSVHDRNQIVREEPEVLEMPSTAAPSTPPSFVANSSNQGSRRTIEEITSTSSWSEIENNETSMAARPFSQTLRIRSKDIQGSEAGYVIMSSSPPRLITAGIIRGLDGNVISIREATNLQLDIQQLGPADGVLLDLGGKSPEKSIGKATLQWVASPESRYPPFTIECEVCQQCQPGLILGRPFINERQQQRSGRSTAIE